MTPLLMAESEEELKSLLMKVKEESERVVLKLNIQKTKILHLNFRKINDLIKKWAKDLNRHFSKEDIQVANKYMKRCFANQNLSEVPLHASQDGCYPKSTSNKCWRGCGEKGTLLHCWRSEEHTSELQSPQ